MNLDDHIEGTYDTNSPANQSELHDDLTLTIQELIEDGNYETAINQLSEVRLQIDRLRQVAKDRELTYFSKKLSEIYNVL